MQLLGQKKCVRLEDIDIEYLNILPTKRWLSSLKKGWYIFSNENIVFEGETFKIYGDISLIPFPKTEENARDFYFRKELFFYENELLFTLEEAIYLTEKIPSHIVPGYYFVSGTGKIKCLSEYEIHTNNFGCSGTREQIERLPEEVLYYLSKISGEDVKITASLKYVGSVGTTGYAKATRCLTEALRFSKISYTFEPVFQDNHPILEDTSNLIRITDNQEYSTVIFHAVPCSSLARRMKEEKSKGKKILLITIWETLRIPKIWKECLEQADLVLNPVNWNMESFEKICAVKYFPHPVIGELYTPSGSIYTFYTISEWTGRKNIALLIRAFDEEFGAIENVKLLIKTSSFEEEDLKTISISKKIEIIYNTLSEQEIDNIHRQGCCYVSTAASEGMGYGICEAVMRGRPVISGSFGGQLEYAKGIYYVSTSLEKIKYCCKELLIHKKCGEKCLINPLYDFEDVWGLPNIDDLKRTMRYLFEKNIRYSTEPRDYLLHHFSIQKVGENFQKILEEFI